MELDLLGLGLPPATATEAPAPAGHGGSPAQQRPYERASGFDEPLRFAAAAETTPSPARARVRRRAAGAGDGVPAPPGNKPRPSAAGAAPWPAQPPFTKVRVPGAAGDSKSPRASPLGSFRGIFPPMPRELASAPSVNEFGSLSPDAAGAIFDGAAAASGSNLDHSTAPLTIIYAGSVRAFDSVPMEQAEKILLMTAQEAQAVEIPAFQHPMPQLEPATAPQSSAEQMMMLLGLANVRDSLLPKRTASLARFLHKRKQSRVNRASTMAYPRGEELCAQMDPSTVVNARARAPFGDMEQPWASEDHSKSMNENHGEESVNTELKI